MDPEMSEFEFSKLLKQYQAVIPLKSICWHLPELLALMPAAGFSFPTNVDFHKCRHIQMSPHLSGYIHPQSHNSLVTRNCSKLRKIHSGLGPISLTINPSEFKLFGQFALLWFKFSCCQLMSLQFLHMTSMTRDPSTSIPVYCQGMRKICSDDQKMKYDKMIF